MRFSAEMAGVGFVCGSQIPTEDRQLLISALDQKPVGRIVTDNPANLALKFFQGRHACLRYAALGSA